MSQFDVHRFGGGLVVDCQSDLLRHIDTRFVVPLAPGADAPLAVPTLNPVFTIDGETFVMITEAASAVERRKLGAVVESLAHRAFEITGALDVLIGGV